MRESHDLTTFLSDAAIAKVRNDLRLDKYEQHAYHAEARPAAPRVYFTLGGSSKPLAPAERGR